jgi:hypothetical protein
MRPGECRNVRGTADRAARKTGNTQEIEKSAVGRSNRRVRAATVRDQ